MIAGGTYQSRRPTAATVGMLVAAAVLVFATAFIVGRQTGDSSGQAPPANPGAAAERPAAPPQASSTLSSLQSGEPAAIPALRPEPQPPKRRQARVRRARRATTPRT